MNLKKLELRNLLAIGMYCFFFLIPTFLANLKIDNLYGTALVNVTLSLLLIIINYDQLGHEYLKLFKNRRYTLFVFLFCICLVFVMYLLHFINYVNYSSYFIKIVPLTLLSIFKGFGIMFCLHLNEAYLFNHIYQCLPKLKRYFKIILALALFIGIHFALNFTFNPIIPNYLIVYYFIVAITLGVIKYFKVSSYTYVASFLLIGLIFAFMI